MPSLVADRGRYYAQFYSPLRQPQRKKVPLGVARKRDAAAALRRMEGAVAAGTFDPWSQEWDSIDGEGRASPAPETCVPDVKTLGEGARAYLLSTAHLRPNTVRTYTEVVNAFVAHARENLPLSDLTAAHVKRWVDSTTAGDVTRRKYVAHVGYLLRYLVRSGHLESDLTKDVGLSRVPERAPRAMTDDMVEALVATARQWALSAQKEGRRGYSYDWLADLVEMNVDVGLRRGEIVALRPRHVDLEVGTLAVRNEDGFETKSGRERIVPLSSRARGALVRRLEVAGQRVFESVRGPLSPHGLTAAFRRVRRAAGLPEWVNLHSTRHTALTRLAERGVPLEVIRQVAGHSSVTVTERYTRLRPDVVADHVRRALG